MQTGRFYRAAPPRGSSPWFDWNRRAPNRLFLRGGFGYGGGTIIVPVLTMSDQSSYQFISGVFTWTGSFSAGLFNFNFLYEQVPTPHHPGCKWNVVISDLFGSVLGVEWTIPD